MRSASPGSVHLPLGPHTGPSLSERLLVRVRGWRFISVSLAIHLAIVVLLGGVVLFRAAQPMEDFTASGGSMLSSGDEGSAGPPEAPAPTAQDLPPMEMAAVAPDTTLQMITSATANPSSFSVAPAVASPTGQSLGGVNRLRAGGPGGLPGVGAGAGSGGLRGSFFGVKSSGRHIAFLIDYSGSMDGPFRAAMEKELERCLRDLGGDAKVLIIPWSGGAWLHTELAGQIASKWVKGKAYDDFELVKGAQLAPPKWFSAAGKAADSIMEAVRAQKAWAGGTDWRQPFRYAMRADPPPEQIFFMTDGQIIDLETALSDITASLGKARQAPQVTALWIENPTFKAESLKALAQRVKGEFRQVSVKDVAAD